MGNTEPVKAELCSSCHFFVLDYGIFTATGWTRIEDNRGNCHYDRMRVINKGGEDFCASWRKKLGK